jgi:hypothetical protein
MASATHATPAGGRMDESPHKAFGLAIAFLFPGFAGLWTLSRFVPSLKEWLRVASAQETTVAGFLLIVLASVGAGVFLGGVRAIVLDEWIFRREQGRFAVIFPEIDHRRRTEGSFDSVYIDLRESYFRYFQFYAHTLVVLPLAVAGSIYDSAASLFEAWVVVGGATLVGAVLFHNAHKSLRLYRDRLVMLLDVRADSGDYGRPPKPPGPPPLREGEERRAPRIPEPEPPKPQPPPKPEPQRKK